jgi:hypothetical protein
MSKEMQSKEFGSDLSLMYLSVFIEASKKYKSPHSHKVVT